MIARFLCWLFTNHFTRRAPKIRAGVKGAGAAYWLTRVSCRCGHLNTEVVGLPAYSQARHAAAEAAQARRELDGWGVEG